MIQPFDDMQQLRVNVHVMERCCPYVSRYAVGRYPSELEARGWSPALTFHAFKFDPRLSRCWAVIPSGDSHVWSRIPTVGSRTGSRNTSSRANSQRFCLPHTRVLANASAIYYLESAAIGASAISQPLHATTTAATDQDMATLPGWQAPPSSSSPWTTTVTEIYPLGFYYWRQVLPRRLIADVWLQVTTSIARHDCGRAHAVAHNWNDGFALDPLVFVCVLYAPVPMLNPWLNVTHAPTLAPPAYVTELAVEMRAAASDKQVQQLRKERQDECSHGWQPVRVEMDRYRDREGNDRPPIPDDYELATADGMRMRVCMQMQPLLVDADDDVASENGELRAVRTRLRPAAAFVDAIEIDVTQAARSRRMRVVHSAATAALAKNAPRGRLP